MIASTAAGSGEQAKLGLRPSLLAVPRADRHVEDACLHPQMIGRHRDFLAGHVVDVEFEHGDDVGIDLGRGAAFEHQCAQDVRQPGQCARSRATARAQQTAGLAPRSALRRGDEMPQDSGARGRHALAGDAVVVPRIARQQQARRGGRHRQQPVRRAHGAATQRERRRRPVRAVEPGRDASGRDDVEQRIPVRELMEMHLVDRMPCTCASASASSASSASACSRVGADSGASPICRRSDAYGVPASSCAAPAITLTGPADAMR